MDGLSVAASIVGVISLAMQLSQTTRKLIAFLGTIKEAPSEVTRLNDLLKLIFAMAAGVVNALEHQRSRRGDMFPGHDHLRDVLVVCLERVSFIYDLVDKIETPKGGRNLASKGWAKFTLAMKKDEILELERQLGQALSVLNIMLTTSLLYEQAISISSPAASTHPISGATLTSSDGDSNIMSNYRREVASTPCHDPNGVVSLESGSVTVSTSSRSCDWGNFITLSSESRRRRRRYLRGNSNQPQTETVTQVFRVIPGFLSRSIELVYNRLEDHSLSIALRMRHVIPDKDWFEVTAVIARDDASGLQKLISGGVCTINSLTPYHPMIVVAEMRGSTKVATFLHSQGCDFDTTHAPYTLGANVTYGLRHSPFRLVASKLDLVEYDPFDIIPCWDDNPGHFGRGAGVLDAIEWLVVEGYKRTALSRGEYFGSLLCIIAAWWQAIAAQGLKDRRNELTADIIASGANIHHKDRSGRTALVCLIRYSTPGKDPYAVAEWLEILRTCQVNNTQYIREECRLAPDPFDSAAQMLFQNFPRTYASHKPRRLRMDILDTDPHDMKSASMSWIYPSSPASNVLQEFAFLPDLIIRGGSICWKMEYWLDLWKQNAYCTSTPDMTLRQFLEQWMLENLTQRSCEKLDALKKREISEYDEKSLDSALEGGDMEWAAILVSQGNICRCDSSGEYVDLWPFSGKTHTLCGTGNMSDRACLAGKGRLKSGFARRYYWCEVHCCRFNHERFARKQEKKRLKQMRMMGLKTRFYVPPMPGTWID